MRQRTKARTSVNPFSQQFHLLHGYFVLKGSFTAEASLLISHSTQFKIILIIFVALMMEHNFLLFLSAYARHDNTQLHI